MKKYAGLIFLVMTVCVLSGCAFRKNVLSDESQWNCSVFCEESHDGYVIAYSDEKIVSQTGTLTVRNGSDFDITVHLLCPGEQERVSVAIPAGKQYAFRQESEREYTVGVHADVKENTEIKVSVYDGESDDAGTFPDAG